MQPHGGKGGRSVCLMTTVTALTRRQPRGQRAIRVIPQALLDFISFYTIFKPQLQPICSPPHRYRTSHPIKLLGQRHLVGNSHSVLCAVALPRRPSKLPFKSIVSSAACQKQPDDIIAFPALECHYSHKKEFCCLTRIQSEILLMAGSPSPTSAQEPDADDKWCAADFIPSAHQSAASALCLTVAPPSSLSADLSQLQLQTPRDAQRQGGAGRFPGCRAAASQSGSRRRWRSGRRRSRRQPCHPAITGPSRSLPGGEEPTSPAGVRTPVGAAASQSACDVLPLNAPHPKPNRRPPDAPPLLPHPPPSSKPAPFLLSCCGLDTLQTKWYQPLH